ncbi:MAG: SPOR domain-containing protein, partial [Betaproteobacteria bacterium]|nr:SPOR domain-containing protein [Betaproteobacteria bacterium]
SAKSAPKPASAVSLVPAKPLPAAPKPADDGGRARALLDGETSASSAPSARVVVQVGAFADAGKLAEVRQKLEKLGLKTYTQVIEVEGSKRTRVRVGPFDNRADADKAAARIRAAGLPAAILTL